MGFLHFFAHEGHDHTIPANMVPWWQDELSVSMVIVVAFVLLLLFLHYVFKAKFALTLVVAMAFLLVVGVGCYTVAPILSIVSLSLGMFLALASTMLQLAHKNSPGK